MKQSIGTLDNSSWKGAHEKDPKEEPYPFLRPAVKRELRMRKMKKGNGKRGKGRNKPNPGGAIYGLRMKHDGMPIPPRITTWLRFQKDIDMNNAGVAFANVRFEPTFCYDVDPVVGSTAMPGFAEYAGLYRFYRCIFSRLTVHFSSADANPITVYICPMNFDPTANSVNYQNYLSNPNSKIGILGLAQGNGKVSLHHHAGTDKFAGSRWVGDSDSYCALSAGAAAPANNWFWVVGGHNLSNFTNGVFCSIVLDIEICFFEQTTPAS